MAVSFYAASIAFVVSDVAWIFAPHQAASDKLFAVSAFSLGAVIWAALGRSQWKRAKGWQLPNIGSVRRRP